MTTDTLVEDSRWNQIGLDSLAEAACDGTLVRLGLSPDRFEISLLGCNDARIATLNADFRGKPQPTNVLSWPAEELAAETPGETPRPPSLPELGDIAIAYETCLRESEAAGKPVGHHVTHLLVHGALHLLGYDHIHEQDAALMERIEAETLALLGIPDPYRVD